MEERTSTPRYWVEKTIVQGRPDRLSGENALGRALWSPQLADKNRDIYWPMREVKPGDIVFHFVDNRELEGYSIVAKPLDDTFIGIKGTQWADKPAYRIELANHTKILPPIDRNDFLRQSAYKGIIENLLNTHTGLFFNREFNLNQGAYLTEAPLELVQLWNHIHLKRTGRPLNPNWNIPSLVIKEEGPQEKHRYWIFQGNPDQFDMDEYLRGRKEIVWTVRQNRNLIHAGDNVLIWRAGPDGGVIAQCVIRQGPDASIQEDAPELWRDKEVSHSAELRCRLEVESAFVENPVARDEIKQSLPDLSIIKFANATNFEISKEEYERIVFVKEHPKANALFDSTALEECWIALKEARFEVDQRFLRRFIVSLLTKPFVILTGNSGTGKTKLAQLFAHWLAGSEGYTIVPVGADWTDNRNVIGFVNYLRMNQENRPTYQGTPVLEILLQAKSNPHKPYFLILDEMNLSHVERYFADFLSSMESHKPVSLHGEMDVLTTAKGNLVENAIAFPNNVFVVGTVNVDETTYMFSPKVLDRANVLEFRVSVEEARRFLEAGAAPIRELNASTTGYAEAFVGLCLKGREQSAQQLSLYFEAQDGSSTAFAALNETKRTLEDLFSIMSIGRQEFAYRTMSEILRFVTIDYELRSTSEDWRLAECIDAQILQKILPKLHGSRKRIEPLLVRLAKYCERGDLEDAQKSGIEEKLLHNVAEPKFAMSYDKVWEMLEAVRRDQFVSFIE